MRRIAHAAAALALVAAFAPAAAAEPDPAGPEALTSGSGVEGQPSAQAEPTVVTELTALPAPQPGAESYPRPSDGVYDVTGGGFGHRIGMSQYGAHGAGLAGLDHAEILDFYYPGTDLETRSIGTIRIGITIDSDGVLRVSHRSGLRVSSTAGGTTYALPSGRTQWRVRTATASASSCVLEGYDGSSWSPWWPSGMTHACPVSFSSPTDGTVDLYLPSGSVRIYRGAVTATYRGSTSLATVNHVSMQHYLRSVVAAEMDSSFHPEALKAQAVAARTYALRGVNGTSYYDTCDTTSCQAYRGRGYRNSDGSIGSYEYSANTAAVDATNGQVLTYLFPTGRKLATTMYSASSGGWTAPAGNGHDYMPAHADPYDATPANTRHRWSAQLPVTSLESRYGIHRVERVQILTRDGHGEWGGRVLTARVEGFDSAGRYVYANASGSGIMLARYWPSWRTGLSSDYFTFGSAAATPPPAPTRLAGTDRYGTAAAVAATWSPGVSVVYVASGQDYADALGASSRAGIYDAPVLLTESGRLPSQTRTALSRLAPSRIVVIGGLESVDGSVFAALTPYATSGRVERVAGDDRYGTAAALASYYPSGVTRVYLASGEDFPDALAGAALSGARGEPLLLTRHDRLDSTTLQQLDRLDPGQVVVLGGSTTVSKAVVDRAAGYATGGAKRLAGTDRYQTSAAIAEQFSPPSSPAYVAAGTTYPDALVGSALAGRKSVPLVLTAPDQVTSGTARALQHGEPETMVVLGGATVIPDRTVRLLAEYLQ